MRIAIIAILSILLVFLVVQIWYFYSRGDSIADTLIEAQKKLDAAKTDYESLKADADYYSQTANIEKELRARFNYKLPGENMIVVVPTSTTSTNGGN